MHIIVGATLSLNRTNFHSGRVKKDPMTKQKRTQIRITAVVSISLVIAAISYGFAQANMTHSSGILGAGYGVKSPYEVSNINYVLDLEEPSTFTAVCFVLDQEIDLVQAGVSISNNGQIIWTTDCELTGPRWTCSFGDNIDLLAANWLHVISAQ